MPIEFAAVPSARLNALPRRQTVFFFPVGPLEDHGPHLPMGQDVAEAEWLCRAAAERLETELQGWTAVIMPAAPLGIDSDTTEFRITVRPHVLRDWIVDACRSLGRNGFVHFACFSGHLGPRQLTALEEAGKIVGNSSRLRWVATWIPSLLGRPRAQVATFVSADSGIIPAAEVRRSPLWPDALEHGGARDTSVALAIHPARVEPSYSALPPQEREPSLLARSMNRFSGHQSGYWGDPAKARAEAGQLVLKKRLDEIFPKLRAVWAGANANMLFRSWYSVLPPNKSFFKAWLIALATVAFVVLTFAIGFGSRL